jgi:uncharacterized protein YcbK (DUF882 family)
MDEAAAAGQPRIALGRRAFVVGVAGAALALSLPRRALAVAETRRLRLLNAHTSERLDVTYCEEGALVPDALASVDQLLRDVRTGDVHPIDPGVLDIAWTVAAAVGHPRATLEIVCGYRSPQTNAMLHLRSAGVAVHSLHLEGKAIDLRLRGVATERLRDAAVALRRGGVGFYPASDFVHLDSGRVRLW